MIKTNDMQNELLQDDPLYAVLQDTPLEETLYTESYLTDIIEKKLYSISEVASWFNITDAQLQITVNKDYLAQNLNLLAT